MDPGTGTCLIVNRDSAKVTIIFATHATSLDNERGLASAWYDADLSPQGIEQARELGARYAEERFDTVFCSDQLRAFRTAAIAFGDRDIPIIRDRRLRECDYGEMTRRPVTEVESAKPAHVTMPFPGGESYEQAAARIGAFLRELVTPHPGGRVLIIGSRATRHGLEHWVHRVPLLQAVTTPFQWQPGWFYSLDLAAMTAAPAPAADAPS
jgi:broad specificity phosphatase PhoE